MSSTLLDQITAAVADEYAVVGQLGESSRGSAFLARERAGGHLVVLAVPPSADELSVLASVGDEVPANAGACTACGTPPATFTTACPTCGRAFVVNAVDAHRLSAAEVQAAAAHAYDVLGEVAHQAGGSLFFVRDRADGRLVALAGRTDEHGGQALEAVWDAFVGDRAALSPLLGPADLAPQPAPNAPPSSFAPFDAPSFAPPVAVEHGGPGALDADPPPGYPPDFRPVGPADEHGATPRRRRWVPLAATAAVVLAAGGAWAAMRSGQPAPAPTPPPGPAGPPAPTPPSDSTVSANLPRPPVDSTHVPPPVGGAARGGISPTASNDSAALAARDARRHADSVARAPAVVTLEGSMPGGWTWTVNGRPGPPSMTARLRLNRPNTLSIEAPGYCPEVLQIPAPAPGSTQRWVPRLRGKPMVGEC